MKTGRIALLPPGPPLLQVVVDTEEEFDWAAPFDRASVGVTAIQAQHEMQAMMTRFGLLPSYVVDYPVATTPASVAVLRKFLDGGQCLIGTHLHPWVSPPHTEQVSARNSYPGNLAPALEREKLLLLTEAIERSFGLRPTMYKAGRYGVGPSTAATLKALGYKIDLSVIPHSDFSADGGTNFRGSPDRPNWVASGVLEIPMSRGFSGRLSARGARLYPAVEAPWGRRARLGGVLSRLGLLERVTLTPEGVDIKANRRLIDAMLQQGHRVFTLAYHSPSLAVGHTPYVQSEADLLAFHDNVRQTVEYFFQRGAQPTTPIEVRKMALEAEAGGPMVHMGST